MKELEDFIAPTEDIELQIVEFCLNKLKLEFGEFWYNWFTSNNKSNATVHINCNKDNIRKLREKFSMLPFVNCIFKVQKNPMEASDFKTQYYIHFKVKQS